MTARGTKYWQSGAIPLIAPDILGDIIAEVADIGIVINQSGTVLSLLANPTFDGFKKMEHLKGRDVRTALTVESVSKFDSRLASFLNHEENVRPIELNHSIKDARWELLVRYSFHRIGPDGAILMLGRDLRPIAEMQQQLVKAQMALEQDYEAQREFETRFRVLLESTPVPVVLVSLQSGRVIDANSAADQIAVGGRDHAIGARLSDLIQIADRTNVIEALSTSALSKTETTMPAVRCADQAAVLVTPTLFRAAGDRLMICRIATLTDADAAQNRLSQSLHAAYQLGPDSMVFTNAAGVILSANDAFLRILGSAHDLAVKGRSLADFLQRGSVDLKVMTENAVRAGQMRHYSTKIAGDYGSPRSVEIAVTTIDAGEDRVFAFMIREASQSDVGRTVAGPDDDMQSVIELVGSATLKEIVAETTNVVEKMCIETAIELTMNNRVAAADMLGLSRQSLYVKLRKFGILDKDGSS